MTYLLKREVSKVNEKSKGDLTGVPRRNEVVDSYRRKGTLYILRKVVCHNKRCKSCPHGPYWYAVVCSGGIRREIYLGKDEITLEEFNLRKKIKKLEEEHARLHQANL